MDTLVTFLLAVALTLFFVRSYLKKLTETKGRPAVPTTAAAAGMHRARPCPRCGKAMELAAAFCSACGVPMKVGGATPAKAHAAD
jgi:hypothetical protein